MKQRLKVNGILMGVAALAVILFPKLFFRHAHVLPAERLIKILGFILVLMGQLFRASARGYKAAHSDQGKSLIQNGPYSFVRNPMYFGIFLIGTGMVLILFQWWTISVFLSIFALRYIALALSEEKKLLGLFGGPYKEYCRRVPRLAPSSSGLFVRDMREYLPLEYAWLKKEAGSALALLLPLVCVEAWINATRAGMPGLVPEATARILVFLFFALLCAWLCSHTKGRKGDSPNRSKSS